MNLIFVVLTLSLINLMFAETFDADEEYAISSTLLQGYNKEIRAGDLTVQLKFTLNQIVKIDEINQQMLTSSLIEMIWKDSRLAFNTTSGIGEVLIPADLLWLPDMFVVNTASVNGFLSVTTQNLASVSSDGTVRLTINLSGLITRCQLDYYKFPYDVQECDIEIGSWQNNGRRIDFDSDDGDIDVSQVLENHIFLLEKSIVLAKASPMRFPVNETATDIIYRFTLRRRSSPYMLNVVLPTLILSCITLLEFNYPFGNQITVSIIVFLNLAVYSLRVSGEFPTQGTQIPLIFVYFTFGIILDFLALIFFVFKDYLVRRDDLPNWLLKPGVYLLEKSKQMGKNAENPEMQSMSKCNNCDLCQKCEADKKKDKEDDDKKDLNKKILRIFNRLVFFVFLFVYFLCYTIVWSLITS